MLIFRFAFKLDEFASSSRAISWPLVALLITLIFRNQIKERISSILEVRAGSTTTVFNASKADDSSEEANTKLAEISSKYPSANIDQNEIEEIIRVSAAWGFNMAHIGFTSTPIPIVQWEGNTPRILYGQSPMGGIEKANEKAILIEKILDTQNQIDSLSLLDKSGTMNGFFPTKESTLKKQLSRLGEQLKAIDPNSTFIPK